MNYPELRRELREYYQVDSYKNSKKFSDKCTDILDGKYIDGMSAFEMKALQYDVISNMCEPVIFANSPFYYETGIIPGFSDGCRDYKGYRHVGGWTYFKNEHLFIDQDPELWELRRRQGSELMYLVCGKYNDTSQHFILYLRHILKGGLRGIYERAKSLLTDAAAEERPFLESALAGLRAAGRIAGKFAQKASELALAHPENENYRIIAGSARRCPWEKPQSFYEALNCCAFMRKAVGSLEGVGPNSFGRLDVDLYPFYEADIKSGRLTKAEAKELIAKFLITWDSHYDHDMKMVGYADHELENTYVLGGCDADGAPVYNDLTELFLTVNREEGIIFPKIKCRYSKNSPEEYLRLISEPIIKGITTVIIQNDDAVIPALIRAGRTEEDARDYLVSGCWGMFTNGNDCHDDASYMNLLKVLEFTVHNRKDKMKEVNMPFASFDGAEDFDEVYGILLSNFEIFFKERTRVITAGAGIWSKVDPLPFYTATLAESLDMKKDFTQQGARYKDDVYMCVGFPNIVDSLMAIKTLCFDRELCTLGEFLDALRNNWDGKESLRLAAASCPGWGDGSEASCALARRLHTDIYSILSGMKGIYGGRINMGHLTYTEIRFWGEKTLATPDGRRNGEYFSQGLTPSRLKKIPSVTSVAASLSAIDKTELAGNNVVNLIMPEGLSSEHMDSFLRAFADTAMESLQLNCVSKETLLDARKHPEKYPDLIIRVCGFSAKFTSLSPEWQDEIISRNFYE